MLRVGFCPALRSIVSKWCDFALGACLFFVPLIVKSTNLSTDTAISDVKILENLNDPDIANLFKATGLRLLNMNVHPLLAEQMGEVIQIVQALSANKNSGEIYVAFTDSVIPNTFFAPLDAKKSLIVINLGLFRTIEVKDVLVYLLGHEYSHGRSKLQAHIDKKYAKTGKKIEDLINQSKKQLFQRVVENEVDIAAIRLTQDLGYNAHAGARWLRHMANLNKGSSGADNSHTTVQSRIDTLDSTTAYWQKVKGETLLPDTPESYSLGVVGRFNKEFFQSGEFKNMQIPQFYKAIEDIVRFVDRMNPRNLADIWHPYNFVATYWDHAFQFVDGILTDAELQKLKIDFFISVVHAFDQAHEKAWSQIDVPHGIRLLTRMMRLQTDEVFKVDEYDSKKRKSQSVYLAKFFNVGTLEELPNTILTLRQERHRKFPQAKLQFHDELMRLSKSPSPEFLKVLKRAEELQWVHRSNQSILPLAEIFSDQEIKRLFEVRARALELHGESEGFSRLSRSLRNIDLLFQADTKMAMKHVVQVYRDYYSSPVPDVSKAAYDDRVVDEIFWPMEYFSFQEKVVLTAFSDKEVRQLIIRRFFHVLKSRLELYNFKISQYLERFFEIMNESPLQQQKSYFENEALGFFRFLSLSFQKKFDLTALQAKIVIFLKYPVYFRWMRDSKRVVPSVDELISVIKTLPANFIEESSLLEFSSLFQLFGSLPKEEMRRKILDMHQFFKHQVKAKSVSFDDLQYKARSNDDKNYRRGDTELPTRDYSKIMRREQFEFENWLEQVEPRDFVFRLQVYGAKKYDKKAQAEIRKIISEALHYFDQFNRQLEPFFRIWKTYRDTIRSLSGGWHIHLISSFDIFEEYLRQIPVEGMGPAWAFLQIENETYDPALKIIEPQDYSKLPIISIEYLARQNLELIPVEQLRIYLLVLQKNGSHSQNYDFIFEHFWDRTEFRKELRSDFVRIEFLEKLYYDSNKISVSRAILENEFNLKSLGEAYRKGTKKIPEPAMVRPEVAQFKNWLVKHFPNPSGVRDVLINDIMSDLLSTMAETEELSALKLKGESWYKSSRLPLLDMPDLVGRSLKDNAERMHLIEYLIGTSTVFEERFRAKSKEQKKNDFVFQYVRQNLRFFRESAAPVRSFIIQGLMGPSDEGVLSESVQMLRLKNLILGSLKEHLEVSAIFDAYFDSLNGGQKKVFLSFLLQSFVDRPAGSKKLSLTTIFNSMGAFGAKAAQAFRTTGRGGASLQKELDHFFDQAQPPERDAIYENLKNIFGVNLNGVVSVRQLLGSGSINYVIVVEILGSDGQPKLVAVRIQKDNVIGTVQFENQIWERAIASIAKLADEKLARRAKTLEEIRRSVMNTLDKNGVEFDLSIERNLYEEALKVYHRSPTRKGEWRVEPVEPMRMLQKLVPSEYSKKVSILELVDGVPIQQVQPNELQVKLAQQIIRIELEAFFIHGLYDRDGHPGNWLVDMKNRRLVRLDYGQLKHVNLEFREGFRSILGILLREKLSSGDLSSLVKRFYHVFELKAEDSSMARSLQDLIKTQAFIRSRSPHERLFLIRDELERNLNLDIKFTSPAGSALNMLARVSLFADSTGQQAFQRSLFDQLNLREQTKLVLDQLVVSAKKLTMVSSHLAMRCESLFLPARSKK